MKTYTFTITVEAEDYVNEKMLDILADEFEEVANLLTDQVTVEYHEETNDGEAND